VLEVAACSGATSSHGRMVPIVTLATAILDALSGPLLAIGAVGCFVFSLAMWQAMTGEAALGLACSVHVVVSMLMWRSRDRIAE
jgi:nitrate reductase NapE component